METTTQGGSIYEQNVSEELDLSGQHAPMASHLLAENGADLQSDREENDSISTKDNKGEVNGMAWEDLNGEFQPEVMNMSREDCWMLIRRFNYMVFGVKATQDQPFGHLDMSIAKDTNTSPERLQAQLARLYMSVIIRLFALWKHLVRLRSWNEPRRTSAFLLVYIIAWVADLLVPTLFCFVSVLVLFPLSRPILFPFAPPSIIDAATGGVQKSPAGVMASESSVTAAPENHKGETIELEAQNFLSSFAKVPHVPKSSSYCK